METTGPGAAAPAPTWKPLVPAQRRVLGVLIEKAKTTPAGYPMSVNAITTGSNQKSNREPLTNYDEGDVERTLGELRDLGVVTEVDWLGRVPKYKHRAYEWLGVDKAELAVLAELLLRGPQTLGDLRARAARMETIEDLSALKPIVDRLVARGLMLELSPPGRGRLVTHGLYPQVERDALRPSRVREPMPDAPPRIVPPATPAVAAAPESAAELERLRAEIETLRARVSALEARAGLRGND